MVKEFRSKNADHSRNGTSGSYERESIFSIGLTASLAISGATSTVGQPNFRLL